MTTTVQKLSAKCASALNELTRNSESVIRSLTTLARTYIRHAPIIVQTIEAHLKKVKPDLKLSVLYLIDSIVRNVKKDYVELFTENIVSTFTKTFVQVSEKDRRKLKKLRLTWNDVFPKKKLHKIDVKCHQTDPGWPITPHSPSTANIHVNPKSPARELTISPPTTTTQSSVVVSTVSSPSVPSTSTTTASILSGTADTDPLGDVAEARRREQQRLEFLITRSRLQLILIHAKMRKLQLETQMKQQQLLQQAEIAKRQIDIAEMSLKNVKKDNDNQEQEIAKLVEKLKDAQPMELIQKGTIWSVRDYDSGAANYDDPMSFAFEGNAGVQGGPGISARNDGTTLPSFSGGSDARFSRSNSSNASPVPSNIVEQSTQQPMYNPGLAGGYYLVDNQMMIAPDNLTANHQYQRKEVYNPPSYSYAGSQGPSTDFKNSYAGSGPRVGGLNSNSGKSTSSTPSGTSQTTDLNTSIYGKVHLNKIDSYEKSYVTSGGYTTLGAGANPLNQISPPLGDVTNGSPYHLGSSVSPGLVGGDVKISAVGSGDAIGESSVVGSVVPGQSIDLSLLQQKPPNSSNVTNVSNAGANLLATLQSSYSNSPGGGAVTATSYSNSQTSNHNNMDSLSYQPVVSAVLQPTQIQNKLSAQNVTSGHQTVKDSSHKTADYVEIPHFREVFCYSEKCIDVCCCDCRFGRKFAFEIEGKEYLIIYEHETEDILTSTPIASYGEFMDIVPLDEIVRCTANCYSFEDSKGWLHIGFTEKDSLHDALVNKFHCIKSDSPTQCGSKEVAFVDRGHDLKLDKIFKVVPCTDRGAAEAADRLARLYSPTVHTFANMDFHRLKHHTSRALKFILVCFAIHDYMLQVPLSEPFIIQPDDYPKMVSPLYWEAERAARKARCTEIIHLLQAERLLKANRVSVVGRTKCPIIQDQIDVSPIINKFDIIRKILLLESIKAKNVEIFLKSVDIRKTRWSQITNNMLSVSEMKTVVVKLEEWVAKNNFDFTEDWDAKLAAYQQQVNEAKPFPCSFCTKRFVSEGVRNEHEHIHKGTYTCTECGKSCRSSSSLAKHSLFHSGDRPFECSCGKTYRHKYQLNKHQASKNHV